MAAGFVIRGNVITADSSLAVTNPSGIAFSRLRAFEQSNNATQDEFEKVINLFKPGLRYNVYNAMRETVDIIEGILKQHSSFITQKTLNQFIHMLKSGEYLGYKEGVFRIIGTIVEQKPVLATQKTLNAFNSILSSKLSDRLGAIETTDIIIKHNPNLDTKKTLDLLTLGGNTPFQEILYEASTIDTILKQNPNLATQKMLNHLKSMLKNGSSLNDVMKATKDIGVILKHKPALASKEILNILVPRLKVEEEPRLKEAGDMISFIKLKAIEAIRFEAIETIGRILKHKPALATKETVDLLLKYGNETIKIINQNQNLVTEKTPDNMVIEVVSWPDPVKDGLGVGVQLGGQQQDLLTDF